MGEVNYWGFAIFLDYICWVLWLVQIAAVSEAQWSYTMVIAIPRAPNRTHIGVWVRYLSYCRSHKNAECLHLIMMTSSNGNISRVTGPLFTGHRSPYKGQWRGALIFFFICAWINGWINSREDGDLRHHHAHYDVTVMFILKSRGEYIERTERLLWGYLEQVALVIKYVIKYRFHSRKIAKLDDLADENSHQYAICILHAPYLCIIMIKMGIIFHSICKPWYCQRIWVMFVRIGLAVPLIWSDVMCVIDQRQYWLWQLH